MREIKASKSLKEKIERIFAKELRIPKDIIEIENDKFKDYNSLETLEIHLKVRVKEPKEFFNMFDECTS